VWFAKSSGVPGTPYTILLGTLSWSGLPPAQYSGKLSFQPSHEIITPRWPTGSVVPTEELNVAESIPAAQEFTPIVDHLRNREGGNVHIIEICQELSMVYPEPGTL